MTNRRTLLRQHRTLNLHACGPRVVLEAMLELEAGRTLDDVLTRYGRLDPKVCAKLGADALPVGMALPARIPR